MWEKAPVLINIEFYWMHQFLVIVGGVFISYLRKKRRLTSSQSLLLVGHDLKVLIVAQ